MTIPGDILASIEHAFQKSERPLSVEDLAVPGLDMPYVAIHYFGKTLQDVEDRDFEGHKYMEDFTYMTPKAVAYYLPSVLRHMIREPDDDASWIYVYGYLRLRKDGQLWWNLLDLDPRQFGAIAQWAEYLMDLWATEPNDYIDPVDALELSEAYRKAEQDGGGNSAALRASP